MSSPKLPSDLPLEELLAGLNEVIEYEKGKVELRTTTLQTPQPFDEITSFLSAFQIRPGDFPVRKQMLYRLYKLWSQEPLNELQFSMGAGNYLLPTVVTQVSYFMINQEAFVIGRRTFELLNKNALHPTKSPRIRQHFENYLKHYEINAGKTWLEGYVLYHLYDKWAHAAGRKKPLSLSTFLKLCRIYLPSRRRSDTEWFAADLRVEKHLPADHLAQLRQGHKHSNEKTKKRDTPKPGKVSRPPTRTKS